MSASEGKMYKYMYVHVYMYISGFSCISWEAEYTNTRQDKPPQTQMTNKALYNGRMCVHRMGHIGKGGNGGNWGRSAVDQFP